MEVIEDRGEATILIGDMNRAVGEGKWGVKGNKTNISYGGKLLRDLLETEEYILLNNLDIVEGGSMDMGQQGEPRSKELFRPKLVAICVQGYSRSRTKVYTVQGYQKKDRNNLISQ